MPTIGGFGERVRRVEDPRFLMGQAQYVDDIKLPNTLDVSFRSKHLRTRKNKIDRYQQGASPSRCASHNDRRRGEETLQTLASGG